MPKSHNLSSSIIISLVTIIVSLTAIFASYHIFLLSQPKREITFNLNPPISLINIKESSKHEFKIFYKDELLETTNIYILNGEMILTKLFDKEASLSEVLLNPQDKVYTRFLVQSSNYVSMNENLNVTARIRGISRIEKNVESSKNNLFLITLIIVTITSFMRNFVEKIITDKINMINQILYRRISKIISNKNKSKVND